MKENKVKTSWMKVPVDTKLTFVGHDAICFGKGCHLIFYNFINGQEHIYSANNWKDGDGIKCYSGHRKLTILAFAEQLINPRIIILKYPDFTKLKILPDGAPEGYMTMVFSDHDYLITLSDLPEYELVVWDWRTAGKFYTVKTNLKEPNQILCCSFNLPVSVIQYYEKANDFIIWEIYNSYKNCVTIKQNVKIPNENKIINCVWNSEGFLFVLDLNGYVYMMNSSFELEVIIYGEITFGNEIPCFTWFKDGLLVLHSNLDITHYKKVTNWEQDFSITPARIKEFLPCSGRDILIAWSHQAELMELDFNKHCFTIRRTYETVSDTFCFIYPVCNYFASICPNNYNIIKIGNCLNGNQVTQFEFKEFITTFASNPVYPYLAVGLTGGALTLLNCYKPEEPKILTNLYLHRKDIHKIVFAEKGNYLVTGNLHEGLFFIIQGFPGEIIKILYFIDYKQPSLDIGINEIEKYINLYILVQNQRIILRSVSKITNRIRKKYYIYDKHKFTNIYVKNNYCIAKIMGSKNICTFTFHRKSIKVTNEINTGHCLKHFKLIVDNYHTTTYGYDGLIIIRDKDLINITAALLPHHRYTGGVEKVIVDPYLRFVISYGTETNELLCSVFLDKLSNGNVTKDVQEKLNEMENMFSAETVRYEPKEVDEDGKLFITYFEMKQKDKIKEAERKFAKERKAILDEFLTLKEEVINLLDQNLNGPEELKIDILEFYLYSVVRKHKEEIINKKCNWIQKYNKELISVQNNIWQIIKKKCHETMEVPGTIITGFFSNLSVSNYAIKSQEKHFQNRVKMIKIYRQLENMAREDLFEPWVPKNLSTIEETLQIQPYFKTENLKETETKDFTDLVCTYLLDQNEIHTISQLFHQLILVEDNHHILQINFNKNYDEIKQEKERDVEDVFQKNNTLKRIISELNWDEVKIIESKWNVLEYPEKILTVEDFEIGITPYISPEEQIHLDAKAAEAERLRLLLLENDFPDKALDKMMEGALEIHWEDNLKKDILKPKCMLDKEEENYTEEDLQEIKEYNEKVEFLNSEREKYRKMLETEFGETVAHIEKVIKQFDHTTLQSLALHKILVEKTRLEDCLHLQRLQNNICIRENLVEQRKIINNNIKNNNQLILWIQNTITELYNASTECKSVAESLLMKEKLIEKNFQRDFQDYSMLVQEQSLRLFNKQPKANLKEYNNIPLLNELSNSCITQERNLLFDQDCLDYLKAIDILDQYVGVPNTVDEVTYKIICKHRRLRFENDLKMQANLLEQSEIDFTIQAFQKYFQNIKELGVNVAKDWETHRERELEFIHDKQIQFVTKAGLIELNQTGSTFDFDHAVLVHKNEVEKVNEAIVKGGIRKINVLNEKMIFRRYIIEKEWEHKKMKMKIEDLEDKLHLIDSIKVTRDVKKILERKDKSLIEESYEKDVEFHKRTFEKIITDRQAAIQELNNQIKEYKIRNKVADEQIAKIKIDINERKSHYDIEFKKKNAKNTNTRMTAIVKRNKLVTQIQEQHKEILILQTELELLKLRTYPTLKFKT